MASNNFEFEIYRLNIIEGEPHLFNKKTYQNDDNILQILEQSTKPKYKVTIEGKKATYEWSLREYCICEPEKKEQGIIAAVTLARSNPEKIGKIVTDDGITKGSSESKPPLADTIEIFFYLQRHLVAVERASSIINSGRWRQAIIDLTKKAAEDLQYTFWLELEPVSEKEEILKAFNSFSSLIRLRVKLRLPNPELTRYSKQLYEEMVGGGVREWLQDMYNPRGLKMDLGKLPHSAVEIAQAGYKKGSIKLQGIREGAFTTVETGEKATRGRVDELRDFVRGMKQITKTKEGKRVTTKILSELDRRVPPRGK